MPMRKELLNLGRKPKIILLGSGGLSIGQAGEFDYSGTQGIKAMQEEGIEVIIVNPNIATVQTNPHPDYKVYLYPVEPEWVEKIIVEEKPDAIVASFGGQTALNCLIRLEDEGTLKKHGVLNLGTTVETLKMTEDRDEFAQKMKQIGMPVPASAAVSNLKEAKRVASKIGFPVIVRAAFALGGLGSGFANTDAELEELVTSALASSPQVLIEKSLKGWKEVEYEVMRDGVGNAITICNMENFDPLGIHTGDSIVVCPSQSLSDDEYQLLRNAALKIVEALGVVGECNVQYALNPVSLEFFVIEVNARLSRSSALASKASGYPIAYIAAKVVLGFDLLELKNPVTGITFAYFEPALDYVTVKIPRWDMSKFRGVSRKLGSAMKSVGEVMGIGRSFPEALQKAVRMVTETGEGISFVFPHMNGDAIEDALKQPTDSRLYSVIQALRNGMDIEGVHQFTSIDKWFLSQVRHIVQLENEVRELANHTKGLLGPNAKLIDVEKFVKAVFSNTTEKVWRKWKRAGFGDEQLAYLAIYEKNGKLKLSRNEIQAGSMIIRKMRTDCGVVPVIKKIDTTAGEYPSPSNYLYMSYGGMFNDPLDRDEKKKTGVVLGGGAYRVGTSVEFDWCAVSCSRGMQKANWRSIMVNCNPETVSTDYNSSDRLYFEELSLERILDIVEFEKADGVVVCMGGQLPNRLALPLAAQNIKLLGHSPETVDKAEDRSQFSALLDELGVDQPRWIAAHSKAEIKQFIKTVNFPVLIRPSYVLSGAAMGVAHNDERLEQLLSMAEDISSDHPVVISEFLDGAREIELDGVAQDGKILTAVVSEHVENAGVHSGDATMVVPAQKLYVETVRQVRRAGRKIAKGLKLNGPFNIQFLAQHNQVKVIECNARAARSFPFVSKVIGLNLADVATDVMIGVTPKMLRYQEDELPYIGVKASMFSFARLGGADPVLGVEMASTGEVGCIAASFDEALLLALEASGVDQPRKGVLVSAGKEKEKLRFLSSLKAFTNLNLPIYATEGTAKFLNDRGFKVKALSWPGEGKDDVLKAIREGWVDLVINIPKNLERQELSFGAQIRKAAAQYGCSLLTDMEKAHAFMIALDRHGDLIKTHHVMPLPLYHN